jgi:carbon-monoxide dehydrogenase medium subunit
MYPFEYVKPTSIAAATTALGNGDANYLAGGMTLLPSMKLRLARPEKLVDLAGLKELSGIRIERDRVEIGAMTRHADVAASAELQRALPALAALAGGIGDPLVRNRGTIGGSLANNDPAADYPAGVLGLGATIVTSQSEIASDQYFLGLFQTALKRGELITAVRFPLPKRAGYVKFPNPASRYAMVGAFVALTTQGVRVAITGAGPCVFRVSAFEAALTKNFAPGALDGLTIPADGLNQDIHGSAEYRASLVSVIARRALAAALAY